MPSSPPTRAARRTLLRRLRVVVADGLPGGGSDLLGGGIYMIQGSKDFPNPGDVALVYLLPPDDPLRAASDRLEGSVSVSEELAQRLAEDPGSLTAVFFLVGGGAIAGNLQLGGPDTAEMR